MATDACEMSGLKLARMSDMTYHKLKRILPPWEITLNPFDAGVCMEFHLSDLGRFFGNFTAISEDKNADCIIMQMPPNLSYFISSNPNFSEEMAHSLTEQYIELILNMKRSGKPFAMWCSSMDKQEMELVQLLESRSLPVFQSSERAIKALSALYKYNRYRSASLTN